MDSMTISLPQGSNAALVQVDPLFFQQGGRCFYCGQPLRREDASVDHVIPSSMGGTRAVDNTVVCCKTINAYFGNLSPKQKLAVILAWNGRLPCPHPGEAESSSVAERPEGP